MAKAALALAVVALARGAYGGMIREIGDRFTIASEGDLGAWMQPDGWEPKPKELPEPAAVIDVPALEAEVERLQAELQFQLGLRQSDSRNLDAVFEQRDEWKARAETAEAEVEGDKAVFDAIRAELVKVVGLPADLKLAEAVAWMADRLSATTSSAETKAKPNSKKEQ